MPGVAVKKKNIYQKLHAIQKEVKKMEKDGVNEFHKYNYLSETQVTELFKGLLEKHGVMFIYGSTIDSTESVGTSMLTNVTVHYEFVDVDTQESVIGSAAGQGTDKGDKGVYKAITGAIKYIFMKTFLIPTGDDPEKDNGGVVMAHSPIVGTVETDLSEEDNIL